MIHTFSDRSILKKIKAKELVGIQVWKGNRFIDAEHVNNIKLAIGDKIQNLDSTIFRVVSYKDANNNNEQKYLVDGQHRQEVIKKYYNEFYLEAFTTNFDVLIHEKTVDSEAEAIEYFNAINNTKPQQDNDPKRMADKYIVALEKHFGKLIRPEGKATKRPFLSNDILRNVLEENSSMLKQSNEFVKRFVERVNAWNNKRIKDYELGLIERKEESILESCIKKKFVLAFDAKLPWIKDCLTF
jgi:hypothetical protein